ncbi:baseplate assembly protein [Exilibacterium tricleocarpae]|uniref:Baseplate assembly protein n=1 Tax=Exilibacterium tricleocarpae TaxID=2591008 RepID=A0A545TZ27_9GAMM|nr:phage baseplate assembly protein V [Exilibacterium tricleocarpae]TQV82479.1 baseplate assembly protein [Exilibacterium tricleocarpae]
MTQQFLGKYRATVFNNIDLEYRGRLQLTIPDVLGLSPSTWAECCAPFSGLPGTTAGIFAVPPIGAAVWVEFEQGDPNRPIWTGGRWNSAADVPPTATVPPAIPPGQNVVIQTTLQNMLAVSDSVPTPISGGIVLKSATGATIVVNDTGIYINNGKGASINLVGPAVTVNNGALVVT